jgi:two-component system, cell cycle response regulator DivK
MNRTILVIENNERCCYLSTFLLERHSYDVVAAFDVASGIEVANAILPLAIVLDIRLPQIDGREVARILRKFPSQESTPIIAVSSYAMLGDREKVLAAGFDGYIEKPINPETFVSQIEIILSSRKTAEHDEKGVARR